MQTEVNLKSLREVRLEKGLTQEQLAKRAHISMRNVVRIERGGVCTLVTAEALKRALRYKSIDLKIRDYSNRRKEKEVSSA